MRDNDWHKTLNRWEWYHYVAAILLCANQPRLPWWLHIPRRLTENRESTTIVLTLLCRISHIYNVKIQGKDLQVPRTNYSRTLRTFQMFKGLYSKRNHIYNVLSYSVNFKVPRKLWNSLRMRVHGTGMVGRVNSTAYKTEPIFTGLKHGKLC